MAHPEPFEEIPSVEELDKRLVVVSPKGWIALLLTCLLIAGGVLWAFFGEIPNTLETQVILLNEEGFEIVHATESGTVKEILVQAGQAVKAGRKIALLQREDNSEVAITAKEGGELVELFAEKDDKIATGDQIALIQKGKGEFNFYGFLPIEQGQQIEKGMNVYIQPARIDVQKYGSIIAKVSSISPYVVSRDRLAHLLGEETLIPFFTQNAPVLEIRITPQKNPKTKSGYAWTSGFGPPEKILPRTIGKALIVLVARKPISYVIPTWRLKKIAYEQKEAHAKS